MDSTSSYKVMTRMGVGGVARYLTNIIPLNVNYEKYFCIGTFYLLYGTLTVLDLIVLVMCVLSICLTCSSLRRAYKLYRVYIQICMALFFCPTLGV